MPVEDCSQVTATDLEGNCQVGWFDQSLLRSHCKKGFKSVSTLKVQFIMHSVSVFTIQCYVCTAGSTQVNCAIQVNCAVLTLHYGGSRMGVREIDTNMMYQHMNLTSPHEQCNGPYSFKNKYFEQKIKTFFLWRVYLFFPLAQKAC